MSNSDETLVGEGATGTPDEKLKGIAQQTLYDIKGAEGPSDVTALLQQRVSESGLEVSDEELASVAADIERDAAN